MKLGKTCTVDHVKDGDRFRCSCKIMESFGLPCVHIIVVLVRMDRNSLPSSLILPRWSKNVKVDKFLGGGNSREMLEESDSIYKSRRAFVGVDEGCDPIGVHDDVGDPTAVRTKGTGCGNAPVGSRGVKRRKCRAYGELGHRRTCCTKGSWCHREWYPGVPWHF
ncbi:hypothetical protein PIB30_069162 [Stylosanthes scabra]|uniref:Protein FAR1-RELATED SEQUENCE n=1 Tax=Stylosanthes scabra TaxID=79078 RepID=A0ABU6QMX1_9FABA|nr:hypothetical protein [Stylosanthes scabra]